MNRITHTWIAVRAVALLEDEDPNSDLVKLLKPFVKGTYIGAWIPDLANMRRGTGTVANHVFKMEPYNKADRYRFIMKKDKLVKKLGSYRKTRKFLKDDKVLDPNWWDQAYKADPPPGKHLANNAMAIRTTIIDLMQLGDKEVNKLVPGEVSFIDDIHVDAQTRHEQLATYFFMLSHYTADSMMPCHCDARKLSSYSKGKLHEQWEKRWAGDIPDIFKHGKLKNTDKTLNDILNEARSVDGKFNIHFKNYVPRLKEKDLWLETVNICRGSFALISILCPPTENGKVKYKYGGRKLFNYSKRRKKDEKLMKKMDSVILHDAVLNTAMAWKDIWRKFP